jgi:hypothetical protein
MLFLELATNYVIPRSISTPTVNTNSTFLLLNNEVHNQTYLSGFTLFGSLSGTITIQVINFFFKTVNHFL